MERARAAIHAHCPGPPSAHPRPCALVAQALGGSVRAASFPATCFYPHTTLERSTVSKAGRFFAAARPRVGRLPPDHEGAIFSVTRLQGSGLDLS